MKRKVIPLFLMLSFCNWCQAKATSRHGISRYRVMQQEGYVAATVLINSTGRPIAGVIVIAEAPLKRFINKMLNYEDSRN